MRKYLMLLLITFDCAPLYTQSITWSDKSDLMCGSFRTLFKDSSGSLFSITNQNLLRSTDNGDTWNIFVSSNQEKGVLNASILSSGTLLLDLIQYAPTPFPPIRSIIYRSTNLGVTWEVTGYFAAYTTTAIYETPGKTIVFSDRYKIYRSTDDGKTWIESQDSVKRSSVNCFTSTSNGFLYAGTTLGVIYRSTNDGIIWDEVSTIDKEINCLESDGDSTIYIGRNWYYPYLYNSFGDLYQSTSYGESWTKLNVPFRPLSIYNDRQGNIYVGAIEGLYFTTNNGGSWNRFDTLSLPIISIFKRSDCFIVGTEGFGMYKIKDNETKWEKIHSGFSRAIVQTIDKLPNGNLVAGTENYGIYISTDVGESWNYSAATGSIYSFSVDPSGIIYAGTSRSEIYRSTDNGYIWESKSKGLNKNDVNFYLATDSLGVVYTSSTFGSAARSYDKANSWEHFTTPDHIYSFSIRRKDNMLFMGSNNVVFRSSNQGGIWEGSDTLPVYRIKCFAFFNDKIFAGTLEKGMFQSTDNGKSWIESNEGIKDYSVQTLLVTPDGQIFCGTYKSIYKSLDTGKTWIQIAELGYNGIFDNFVLTNDGKLLFRLGARIYRSNNPVTSINKYPLLIPSMFELFQNYPNPFNPSTTISFSLPEVNNVQLRVYDYLGREVSTLLNGFISAGIHKIQFDAKGLASGVYFYRIKAGSNTEIKKMVVMK